MPRKLIAGNWKMNCLKDDGVALARELGRRYVAVSSPGFDMLVCPPAPLLDAIGKAINGSGVALGAQDCHMEQKGAHTGDVSAWQLADIGCAYIIVGHSERRQNHKEFDLMVAEKAKAAHAAGLVSIICIGETEQERDAGQTLSVCSRQIAGSVPDDSRADNTVIAYEPVWAIGTGKTPTIQDIADVHAHIRAELSRKVPDAENVRILYGGSVKASNAQEIMAVPNVDGGLVGGASLKAEEFWAIAEACS